MTTTTIPLPHPPRLPVLGNMLQLMHPQLFTHLGDLGKKYGGIYEIKIPSSTIYVATKHKYIKEICDENRFEKTIDGALLLVRRVGGDGLFTARNDEPVWGIAHNILMPGFSRSQMKVYLHAMQQSTLSMCQKWEEMTNAWVNISEDFTRLALETISISGFNHSFDLFKKDQWPPFLNAMNECLDDSITRIKRPAWWNQLFDRRFEKNKKLLFDTVDEIIAKRLKDEKNTKYNDFLDLMLEGRDKKTGSKLEFQNVRYQLITFLVAGHETTSGLLSFALYSLMKNPNCFEKTRKEVDAFFKSRASSQAWDIREVGELKYVHKVLLETLRLYPPVSAIARAAKQPTLVDGCYELSPKYRVVVHIKSLHKDPDIWTNPDEFLPERFEKMNSIPEFAYLPFGIGQRMCIGQHFATVEASIALATVLYHFDFEFPENPKVKIIESATLKPQNFYLRPKLRNPFSGKPIENIYP